MMVLCELHRGHLNAVSKLVNFLQKSCRAVWIGLTMDTGNCVTEHVKMAEVLMRLHARKAGEPSSDVENMIASSLANTNPVRFICIIVFEIWNERHEVS